MILAALNIKYLAAKSSGFYPSITILTIAVNTAKLAYNYLIKIIIPIEDN